MSEWMSAAEAHRLVSEVVHFGAAAAICGRANDGLVAARAKRLFLGDRDFDDREVPPKFWWARGDVALEQNWASGDFETWIDRNLLCRAYSVEFRRADILDMIPDRGAREVTYSQPEAGNYSSAGECLRQLQETLSVDLAEAERLILRACRAGLVSSLCTSIWWRVTDRYGSHDDTEAQVTIPDWFWENCIAESEAVLNWHSGRFAGKGVVDGDTYKVVVTGVRFRVTDIVELERAFPPRGQGSLATPAPNDAASSLPSGRRLSERWRPWIAELVAHVHDKGIPEGVGSQGQEELINAVADALEAQGHEPLSRSAVQPTIQAVLDRLRSAEK